MHANRRPVTCPFKSLKNVSLMKVALSNRTSKDFKGYADVSLQQLIEVKFLAQAPFVKKAELVALTKVLILGKGKGKNIYTN